MTGILSLATLRCGTQSPAASRNFELGIACFLPSLSELEHATFDDARASMETTHQTGSTVLNEVEKSDVKKIEDEATDQDSAHATGKRKPKAAVSR